MSEFSIKTRQKNLQRMKDEEFDFLVIGGGITGAAVARDAASRGLKVALVEKRDFAWGTSSRSSKLVHGGLRYLENMEFGLVFEALAERSILLKNAPHMVRPLDFYLPVYKGDSHGMGLFSLGLWLYDLLALLRTPRFHERLSAKSLLQKIPCLTSDGLTGGFSYSDASMWDDGLVVETLRSAHEMGAAIANYTEALEPIWSGKEISGYWLKDKSIFEDKAEPFQVRAKSTVICAGPWTDDVGRRMSRKWKNWLNPSQGVHLVFDLKRIPVPGALVMSHPKDGRISFVIPRTDYGTGVCIVGTTDGPSPLNPAEARVQAEDIAYLMELFNRYFPSLNLTTQDIMSAYVGVRPLVGQVGSEAQPQSSLQKVSREHTIDWGPGGSVVVAGGKYTTHRKMAEEIVDFTLKGHKKYSVQPRGSQTHLPVNLSVVGEIKKSSGDPDILIARYGRDLEELKQWHSPQDPGWGDPEGFPWLKAQLKYALKNEMVLHLEDFYLRRVPLFLSRQDHGWPWAEALAEIWSEQDEYFSSQKTEELERLKAEFLRRDSWRDLFNNKLV